MFQRIRRIIALSKKDPQKVDALIESGVTETLPEAGDGKAVFFSEGTEEEYEQLKKEDSGMAAWIKRLKNL